MDLNGFHNYTAHIIITQNTEIGKPELNNVVDKSQYKNALITQVGVVLKKTQKDKSLIL